MRYNRKEILSVFMTHLIAEYKNKHRTEVETQCENLTKVDLCPLKRSA